MRHNQRLFRPHPPLHLSLSPSFNSVLLCCLAQLIIAGKHNKQCAASSSSVVEAILACLRNEKYYPSSSSSSSFPFPLSPFSPFLTIPLPISLPYLIFLLNSTHSKLFQSAPTDSTVRLYFSLIWNNYSLEQGQGQC